jgi:uncharacterized membrane protein YedE/YeeE
MWGAGITAIVVLHDTFPWQALLVWGAIFGLLMLLVDVAWKKAEREHNA